MKVESPRNKLLKILLRLKCELYYSKHSIDRMNKKQVDYCLQLVKKVKAAD